MNTPWRTRLDEYNAKTYPNFNRAKFTEPHTFLDNGKTKWTCEVHVPPGFGRLVLMGGGNTAEEAIESAAQNAVEMWLLLGKAI